MWLAPEQLKPVQTGVAYACSDRCGLCLKVSRQSTGVGTGFISGKAMDWDGVNSRKGLGIQNLRSNMQVDHSTVLSGVACP